LEAGLAHTLRWILSTAGVVVAAILGLKLLALLVEPHLAFLPVRGLPVTPARWDLPYEDVTIPVDDGVRLHGWFIRGGAPGGGAITILFFHGNAENIAPYAALARLAHDAGYSMFLVDYRGYGNSTGSPSEQGIYRDGEAALRYLRGRPDVDPARIVVWGRSIGSCVAVRLAAAGGEIAAVAEGHSSTSQGDMVTAAPPLAGLVLESPFTSARELLRDGGYWLLYPLSLLGSYRFDQSAIVHRVTQPVLVIHGTEDEVVPHRLGRRLFEMLPGRKGFLAIEGGGHNDLLALHADDLWAGVRRFLETLTSDPAQAG
jgi:pimeloyl-ACP methyl ester carboxylesterase